MLALDVSTRQKAVVSFNARNIDTSADDTTGSVLYQAVAVQSRQGGSGASVFSSGFTGRAGEAVLVYAADSHTTVLFADVDGDARADFVLHLAGNHGTDAGWVV